ncbi:MAG: inositol oxygenase [Acidobacteria bacterium]|nr:inositol oxygenase [Acidobacteriota bacterium]
MVTATGTPYSHQTEEHWEQFLQARYDPAREKDGFRSFTLDAHPSVVEFYRLNHAQQTYAFGLAKREEYLGLNRRRMGIWEGLEYLNQLVDDSDPDTDLSQVDHAVQSAESARRDGQPRWFQLTALIHDLGKVLCLWGEPQWAVVGDTFPVGCAWDKSIVYHDFFAANPDTADPRFQTPAGVYEPGCGLRNVMLSWGHDEYLYQVVKNYLPEEALYMIRYHSFYPWHREGAYTHLMDSKDHEMLPWVRRFNPYDLYSKSDSKPDLAVCRPYYQELIAEYFPPLLNW